MSDVKTTGEPPADLGMLKSALDNQHFLIEE
jgi:hypothetical protein